MEETKAEMPLSTQVWGEKRMWLANLCSRKSANVKRAAHLKEAPFSLYSMPGPHIHRIQCKWSFMKLLNWHPISWGDMFFLYFLCIY